MCGLGYSFVGENRARSEVGHIPSDDFKHRFNICVFVKLVESEKEFTNEPRAASLVNKRLVAYNDFNYLHV